MRTQTGGNICSVRCGSTPFLNWLVLMLMRQLVYAGRRPTPQRAEALAIEPGAAHHGRMATADPRSAVIDFLTATRADVPTAEPADARARGPRSHWHGSCAGCRSVPNG